jgi:hypothetical protein
VGLTVAESALAQQGGGAAGGSSPYDDSVPPSLPTDCYPRVELSEGQPSPSVRAPFEVTAVGHVPQLGRYLVATANTSIQPPPVNVFYTDDEGESWRRARGHFGSAVRILSFDRESGRGVAAGAHGAVASTRDGGATWTTHGVTARGVCFVQVLVHGQATVLVDQEGRVYRSRRGGAERSLIVEDLDAVVRLSPDAIEVVSRGRRYRVLPDGNLLPP